MLFTHAHCLWSKLSDQTLVYTLRCLYIYIYISHIYEIYSKCWCNSQPKFILHSTYVLIVCERGNNERKNTDKSISDSVNSDDIQFIGWSIYGAYRHTVINAIYIFFSFFILPDKQMSNSFSLVFFFFFYLCACIIKLLCTVKKNQVCIDTVIYRWWLIFNLKDVIDL
jgi:hypothetical protein